MLEPFGAGGFYHCGLRGLGNSLAGLGIAAGAGHAAEPQGGKRAEQTDAGQIAAEVPGGAIGHAGEHGGDHGGHTRGEDGGELINKGDARVTHRGVEAFRKHAGHGAEHGGVQDAEGQRQGKHHAQVVAGEVMQHPEGREAGDTEQHSAHAVNFGFAVLVGHVAPEGDEAGHDEGRNHHGGQGCGAANAVLLRKIGERIHAKDVEGHAVDKTCAHAGQHHLGVTLEGIQQGILGFRHLLLGFRKVLGFLHGAAHVAANGKQHGRKQEGNAPAPVKEGFVRKRHGEEAHNARGKQQAKRHADLRQAGVKGALVGRCGFVRHEHRAAPLAAKANALGKTADDQQDRRPDADGVIGGDKADANSSDTHDFQGQDEHFFTAQLVAEVAKNHAAQRPRHKADRKCGKSKHSADTRVKIGEIQLVEEKPGHNAVQEEVVPFDDGADDGRSHNAAQILLLVVSHLFAMHGFPLILLPGCSYWPLRQSASAWGEHSLMPLRLFITRTRNRFRSRSKLAGRCAAARPAPAIIKD